MYKKGYQELEVWQVAMDLVVAIYELTTHFPKEEIYGITSQLRRAAISIPSNVAEGSKRSQKEFGRFIRVAFGSGAELETQLEIAKRLNFLRKEKFRKCDEILERVMQMLNKMDSSLNGDNKQRKTSDE